MMSLTQKALWVIERNLDRDLTLAELAKSCEVSRFHLAHAFGEATGRSVMDYVRGRRLTAAAHALAGGAGDILAVALDAGYSSHEAFTRAFRSQFGTTPEEVRNRRTTDGLALVEATGLPDTRAAVLERPRMEKLGTLLFVGLSELCPYGQTQHIAGQWQRFMSTFYGEIENHAQSIPVGVATANAAGDLIYVCAAEVSNFGTIPRGLVKFAVEPATYAVFEHKGHITTLHRTYVAIWNDWFPTEHVAPAEAPSLERHNPTFDPRTGNGGVTIWIPVES